MRFIRHLGFAGVVLAAMFFLGLNSPIASAGQALTPVDNELIFRPKLGLLNIQGERRHLEDYKGRVLLVNFWATWCPPCVKELPSITRARELLSDEPFDVLAINVGEDKAQIERFLRNRLGGVLNLEVLVDDNLVAVKDWKVRALPTTYIVDHTGRVAYSAMGEHDFSEAEVIDKIRELIRTIPG
ncbi:TlpA family protein disulfide reductase [Arenicellales bacterium nBUS_45]